MKRTLSEMVCLVMMSLLSSCSSWVIAMLRLTPSNEDAKINVL